MNEKTIVYIILLALMLYLYYKKRDIMIILVFVVLLGSTFIFGGVQEGAISGTGSGAGVDKECAKLGFTAPKIDKKDINGSLEKAFTNIQKVANKHWPFDDMGGNKPKNNKAKETYESVIQSEYFQGESKKLEKNKEKQENSYAFVLGCAGLYDAFVGEKASEEKQTKIMKDLTPDDISNAIKGGEIYLNMLTKNHKTLEGIDVKNLSSYLTCLCKQWLQILKQYQKAKGNSDGDDDGDGDGDGDGGDGDGDGDGGDGDGGDGGDGDGGGDDDDEGNNKKKKSSSKKKKSEDDGGEDE